jgi:hypothetical protein
MQLAPTFGHFRRDLDAWVKVPNPPFGLIAHPLPVIPNVRR